MNRKHISIWLLFLAASAVNAADYYPLEVGLTWITRTVAHQDDGRVDTLYDTTWIYEKGIDEEGHEIFRINVKTNGGIGPDSIYLYKVGNVIYRRSLTSDGEHLETDEFRTALRDGMTYTASMVNLDTRDTIFRLQVHVKYIGKVETPFSPFDSCFEVSASSPLLEGSSASLFGPNVGRVKTSTQSDLGGSETELLYFGIGLPVTISSRRSQRDRNILPQSRRLNAWISSRERGAGGVDLLGRASNKSNVAWNRILIGKL